MPTRGMLGLPASPGRPSSVVWGVALPAFHVMASGCGGIVERDLLGPTRCLEEPTVAGLWFARHSRTVWLGFACDRHAGDLIAPRPLLPRDLDALRRRRDQHRTEMAGQRWAGEQEGPVARGAAAERLVERARAWEAGHPLRP
jgi:hypothetical protein